MPLWGPRGTYPAVSATVVVLVAANVVLALLRPAIPPAPFNDLSGAKGEFLQQASRQRIRWLTLDQQPFAEAREQDRPVMLVLGSEWSATGREVDAVAFENTEVVEILNRSFVCVRVDTTQKPGWGAAFLPLRVLPSIRSGDKQVLSSAQLDAGFQIWFLTPQGELLGHMAELTPWSRFDSNTVLATLLQMRDRMHRYPEPPDPRIEALWTTQQRQVALLLDAARPPARRLGAPYYLERLLAEPIPPGGGIGVNGFQRLDPWAWQLMIEGGQLEAARARLDPVLGSRAVDWLQGGFFRQGRGLNWEQVDFDRLAVQNAELMGLCARIAVLSGDPIARSIAERTFDSLTSDFVSGGGAYAYQVVPRRDNGRADAVSFPNSLLHEKFTPSERAYLARVMGLDAAKNPLMTIHLTDPEELVNDPERFEAMLDRLRALKPGDGRRLGGRNLLDVMGTVAARLLETARLLGDDRRSLLARQLAVRTRQFRVGPDGVVHARPIDGETEPNLSDYLAYCEAMLEYFLSGASAADLLDGSRVLNRAIETFGDDRGGTGVRTLLHLRYSSVDSDLARFNVPQVTDGVREASLSRAIRILATYAVLLDGCAEMTPEGDQIARKFDDWAQQLAREYVSRVNVTLEEFNDQAVIPRGYASLYIAAKRAADRSFVAVVGEDAPDTVRWLEQRIPSVPIVVPQGPVCVGLADAAPGVYLGHRDQVFGPLSREEALRAVRSWRPVLPVGE